MLKSLFGHRNVSTELWCIALGCIALGVFGTFVGFTKNHVFFLMNGFAVIGALMIAVGQKRIPANPPEIGLLTIWGVKLPVILSEGWKLMAPYFPLRIDFIRVPVSLIDHDFNFEVLCKAEKMTGDNPSETEGSIGATVDFKVSLNFAPDHGAVDARGRRVGGQRVIQYIVAKLKQGVIEKIEGIIKEWVRNVALGYTWEQYVNLKLALAAELISKITGTKLRQLPRVNGKVPNEEELEDLGINPITYLKKATRLTVVDDVLEYYEDALKSNDKTRIKSIDREIEYFLDIVVANGLSDVRYLGIMLTKFNVSHILPTGKVKEQTDAAAAEKQQRMGEERDIDTDILLAKKYMAENSGISFADALKIVRVNRGRAKEVILTSSGQGNPIAEGAAINNLQNL